MRSGTLVAVLCLAATVVGCGSSAKPTPPAKPIPSSELSGSIKAVLIDKYKSPQPVSVDCGTGTVQDGQVVNCDAVSSAGQGYRVTLKLPCWTATFNGKIIEGPGFLPPSERPKGPIAIGPDNLPQTFSGCVK